MKHIGTVLILLAPAVLATCLHMRLMPKKRRPMAVLGLLTVYAFAIAWFLACLKYLRGKEGILLADSFDTVKNFVVYGPVAALLAALIPFGVRCSPRVGAVLAQRLRGIRAASARRKPEQTRPAPERPAEASAETPVRPPLETSVETPPGPPVKARVPSATLVEKAEASLKAQEAEMVVDRPKVVPSRKGGSGQARTFYNVGTRDSKAVKKTARQILFWASAYALLALLAGAIVYSIFTFPVGT